MHVPGAEQFQCFSSAPWTKRTAGKNGKRKKKRNITRITDSFDLVRYDKLYQVNFNIIDDDNDQLKAKDTKIGTCVKMELPPRHDASNRWKLHMENSINSLCCNGAFGCT